ncbi:hypothetical protein H4R18_003682 [Coemansia javaensis]|uniref:Uncharacterized protein n=1 Tax=Coemansia javaensis TaxID=2761396 RepID=A0A9W8H740_9FUNG|nr:hypothetical protein H4R18_003682 [Coemansia javaensis]
MTIAHIAAKDIKPGFTHISGFMNGLIVAISWDDLNGVEQLHQVDMEGSLHDDIPHIDKINAALEATGARYRLFAKDDEGIPKLGGSAFDAGVATLAQHVMEGIRAGARCEADHKKPSYDSGLVVWVPDTTD